MKNNLGSNDKIIRILIAFVFGALYSSNMVVGIGAIIIIIMGAFLLLTSIIGYCPIYSLLDFNTTTNKDLINTKITIKKRQKKTAEIKVASIDTKQDVQNILVSEKSKSITSSTKSKKLNYEALGSIAIFLSAAYYLLKWSSFFSAAEDAYENNVVFHNFIQFIKISAASEERLQEGYSSITTLIGVLIVVYIARVIISISYLLSGDSKYNQWVIYSVIIEIVGFANIYNFHFDSGFYISLFILSAPVILGYSILESKKLEGKK